MESIEYKGYLISGRSVPMYMLGCESRDSICLKQPAGSVVMIAEV
jgi:hypothetical protein